LTCINWGLQFAQAVAGGMLIQINARSGSAY
jgi:hypothetical protein